MRGPSSLAYASSFLAVATAQYFPPIPEHVTTLQSKFGNGVSISYKEVRASPSSSRDALLTCPTLAWSLRNHAWSEVVRWVCPSPAGHPFGCQRDAGLPDQHLLLVLRVAERPCQRATVHMDERRARIIFPYRTPRRERPLQHQR